MKPEPEVEPAPEVKPEPKPEPACVETFSVDSDRSVLDEQRAHAGAKRWDDFAERYRAEYVDPDSYHPVEVVASHRIGGTPLLWFTPDYADAVVNAAVLTELKVVDAPRLSVDQRVEIGALTELGLAARGAMPRAASLGLFAEGFVAKTCSTPGTAAFWLRALGKNSGARRHDALHPGLLGKIGGRELARFMIEAGVIQTYWHIGASLCLRGESETAGTYRAEFSGEHEYFTNEKNRGGFGFVFELGADGKVALVGAA
ncbi:hypothetical protein ENSA5_47440 [Enhygromyxa salina]|uniref:Uncharacterized protein n=2 Tax=Enhygromyxa salina TaxID=215803 RepID=A0A2S9XJG7_9BACT|nr:hypothetical protein ENSA5_47440 [Enhygromyxa salina]